MVQYVDFDWSPHFPPEHVPSAQYDANLISWSNNLNGAADSFGKPITVPTNMREILTRAGFVSFSHKTYTLDLSHQDKGEWEPTRWTRQMLFSTHFENPPAIEALALYLFTKQLGHQPDAVKDFCSRVVQECYQCKSKLYYEM